MFESPLDWCPLCKDWVALDESFEVCAQRHGCRNGVCPMAVLLRAPQQRPAENSPLQTTR